MKPQSIYVCNSRLEDKTILIQIVAKTPGTTCEMILTKEEALSLSCDLINQAILVSNEH